MTHPKLTSKKPHSVEALLKQYHKRPLTALEIELKLVSQKSRAAIYQELKRLVKWRDAEKIEVKICKRAVLKLYKIKNETNTK